MSEEQNYLECNHCGGPAIYADAHGLFTDGTVERCITCQMPGSVSCDSETEAYWNADENDGDRCIEADCPSCHPNITVSRDRYDLLKEAAEEWSKEQTDNALHSLCVACKVLLDGYTPHRSNCRAARILGLEREAEK